LAEQEEQVWVLLVRRPVRPGAQPPDMEGVASKILRELDPPRSVMQPGGGLARMSDEFSRPRQAILPPLRQVQSKPADPWRWLPGAELPRPIRFVLSLICFGGLLLLLLRHP
jgi:hypothetical protein